MAKKKETLSEASAAISTSNSRYTSPPVTLRVGADLESFYVPEFLLQSLNDLPRSGKTVKVVNLLDVDVDTGHTIVHFLHTAQYQTLRNSEEQTASDQSKADFKKAIAAFIAAKKYGLVKLQELAKDSIFECAEGISTAQAAHGVGKDSLAALQEDAVWLQDLVLRKVEQTFAESDEIFSSASFFNGIDSLELAKILGQRIAELYRSRIRQLREPRNSSDEWETVEQTRNEVEETAMEKAISADQGGGTVEGEVLISQASENLYQGHCVIAEAAIQSGEGLGATVEHVSDVFVAVAELDTESVHEAKENSGVAEPVSLSDGMDAHEPSLSTHPAPTYGDWLEAHFVAKTGPFKGLKKKQRFKLMKELSAETKPGKLLEEGSEAVTGKSEEGAETGRVRLEEETAATLKAVPAEGVPCGEIGREDTAANSAAIDPFVGLNKKEKKKLAKKMEEEAAAKEDQSELCVNQEVATCSDLIEPGPLSAVDMDALDDDHCPFRHEHLTDNEQWRHCSKCEAHMRTMAIKLYRAELPHVNGLVAM